MQGFFPGGANFLSVIYTNANSTAFMSPSSRGMRIFLNERFEYEYQNPGLAPGSRGVSGIGRLLFTDGSDPAERHSVLDQGHSENQKQ
jgi:hypothetical protein